MSALQGFLLVAQGAVASTALPVLAWGLAKTYGRRAAARRLAWVMTFAVLLALPLLALIAPSLAVIHLAAPAPVLEPVETAAPATADPGAGPGWSLWAVLIPLAFAAWLAGLAKLAVEHLIVLVRLEVMRRKATPWQGPLPLSVRGCQLLMSEDCPGPMTWGVLRPVILLPDEAVDWTPARLEAVLRHELAHVRRADGLAQAMALVACALYWPNPLVWAAARALRREAELAADDTVIAAGVLPSDYAGQLLELATEWRERRLTTTGLAMAAPPALSQRVQSALSTDAIRTGATAMDTFKLILVGGVAAAALTLARPSVAETPAPSPSPGQTTRALDFTTAAPSDDTGGPPAAPAAPAAPAGTKITLRLHERTAVTIKGSGDRLQVAAQEVQAAPPEVKVDVQPAPPSDPPPAPAAPAAPAAPPAPSVAAPWTRGWIPNPNPNGPQPQARVRTGVPLTPEQRTKLAELGQQQAELNRQMAQIGPAINKAIADAHVNELVQQELSAQDAKTREMVAKQLAEIGPRIQRAIANAHVQELVAQKMAEIQPQIDAAIARARENGQLGQERAARNAERAQERAQEQAKRAAERAQRQRDDDQTSQPPKN